jgi:hypothetical protein
MTTRQTQAIMRRSLITTIGLAAAGLATIAGLTACGSSAPAGQAAPNSAPSSQVPVSASPANPVTLVRQAGATPSLGEKYGTTVVDGSLDADGTLSNGTNGESIGAYTLPAGLTGQQVTAQDGIASSDSQAVIVGSNFYIVVHPALPDNGGPGTYPVSPATIAARVHGTVLSPAS